MPRIRVELHDLDFPHIREVDRRLIETARAVGGTIVTNDYNLNKVAELHGVKVLNVNELATRSARWYCQASSCGARAPGRQGGRPGRRLPGRRDDGRHRPGEKFLGQTVTVAVTSVLQTAAGRMIFSRRPKTRSSRR